MEKLDRSLEDGSWWVENWKVYDSISTNMTFMENENVNLQIVIPYLISGFIALYFKETFGIIITGCLFMFPCVEFFCKRALSDSALHRVNWHSGKVSSVMNTFGGKFSKILLSFQFSWPREVTFQLIICSVLVLWKSN